MSYVRHLDDQIHSYLLQEFTNPNRCVPELAETDPAEWERSWQLWSGWMAACWRDVASAHAGKKLTDKEMDLLYGQWQCREMEPGLTLLRIINKDRAQLEKKFEKLAIKLGMHGGD